MYPRFSSCRGFWLCYRFWASRAHSFKDARAKGVDINFGTVGYPVLMAADMLYDADLVPVGKKTQHLEMTRDMVGYQSAVPWELAAVDGV